MKRLKSEKGVITMITLVTVLFMVSFLISSYIIVANKVKTQKEMMTETKSIYEPKTSMEEIYNSYFSNENIIPIYTVEQLLNVGSGQQNVYINGKYYNFNNNENTVYMLMNDLSFKASDYEQNKVEETGEYYWTPIGDRIAEYENLTDEEQADETLASNYFQAKFEGMNNTIEVIYLDENNTEYSKKYLAGNNYSDVSDTEGADELVGTWVFNDTIALQSDGTSYDLEFTVSDYNAQYFYSKLYFSEEMFGLSMIYGKDEGNQEVYHDLGWEMSWMKTISISTTLSEMENGREFLTWLKENAVKQTNTLTRNIYYGPFTDSVVLTIEFEKGMTWGEWYESEYNDGSITKDSDGYYYLTGTGGTEPCPYNLVTDETIIEDNDNYLSGIPMNASYMYDYICYE